jgi:hypothetical protein
VTAAPRIEEDDAGNADGNAAANTLDDPAAESPPGTIWVSSESGEADWALAVPEKRRILANNKKLIRASRILILPTTALNPTTGPADAVDARHSTLDLEPEAREFSIRSLFS